MKGRHEFKMVFYTDKQGKFENMFFDVSSELSFPLLCRALNAFTLDYIERADAQIAEVQAACDLARARMLALANAGLGGTEP